MWSSPLIKDTCLCNRQRLLHKITMNQSTELWSPVTVVTCTKHVWLLRLREHFTRWKDIVKSQLFRELLWDCLLVMSLATPINSHQHSLDMSWTRETMIEMYANMDVGKPRMPHPYAKNYKKLWKVKRGRNRLPQLKAHQFFWFIIDWWMNQSFISKWSSLKAYILVTLYRPRRLY